MIREQLEPFPDRGCDGVLRPELSAARLRGNQAVEDAARRAADFADAQNGSRRKCLNRA